MIAKVLHTFRVKNYAQLYKMYKKGKLGLVEQRMSEDIPKQVVGKEGTDEELIINLLSQDPDNIYHVHFEGDKENSYFLISFLSFGLKKNFNKRVSEYDIMFGEDGVWETYKSPVNDNNQDASILGVLEVYN